jgi:hypothetical protein
MSITCEVTLERLRVRTGAIEIPARWGPVAGLDLGEAGVQHEYGGNEYAASPVKPAVFIG